MKFLELHKKALAHNRTRINPHRYWIVILCAFVLLMAGELVYFSWFFLKTTRSLDAPAEPNLSTNAAVIRTMNKNLDVVEEAIETRTGSAIQ